MITDLSITSFKTNKGASTVINIGYRKITFFVYLYCRKDGHIRPYYYKLQEDFKKFNLGVTVFRTKVGTRQQQSKWIWIEKGEKSLLVFG